MTTSDTNRNDNGQLRAAARSWNREMRIVVYTYMGIAFTATVVAAVWLAV